jgi:quinoprotein glucose dehydrogenase
MNRVTLGPASRLPRSIEWTLPMVLGLAVCLSGCGAGESPRAADRQHVTWQSYGGGPDQSKFVALDQITRENVGRLEIAWFYPTNDENTYTFNPIVVDDVMYVLAKNNSLVALNAETGQEIWIHANLTGLPRRGLNYWESPDRSDRRLLITINDYLQAIDARTGQSILSFGDDGLVDLRAGLTPRDPATVARAQSSTPGAIWEDLIILGSAVGEGYLGAPGHIRAYNVVTGKHAWTFHTVPQPGEYGYETWPPEAYRYIGGANVWGEMSVDAKRGIVYAPTASPSYDFYGADRAGDNLFGNSLLALNARTGQRLWHFQTVQHDLRDADLNSAPQLISVNRNGRQIDAVALVTKEGHMYAFDRATGEPLWPVVNRRLQASVLPGEHPWSVNLMPALPPVGRQSMTPADLSPFLTPEERAHWTSWINQAIENKQMGVYVPLSDKSVSLVIPGAGGTTNFGHTASDPARGIVYLISNDRPGPYDVVDARWAPGSPNAPPPGAAGPGRGGRAGGPGGGGAGAGGPAAADIVAQGRTLYTQLCQSCHLENRIGGGSVPTLLGIETRMGQAEFLALMASGRSQMPSFVHSSRDELVAIYRFLGGTAEGSVVAVPAGPVVASGGAPGGLLPRQVTGGGGGGRGGFGIPYPDGIEDVPDRRYFIRGYAEENPHIIAPPWSSILAYDLNTGTIRWKRPLGTDKLAAELGGRETGVQETIRNGLVVTETGLVFSNAKDGHVYAFDAETGEELWRGQIPGHIGTQGIPAMYMVNGRQYLVVSASTPLVWMRRTPDPLSQGAPRGYVAFALPAGPAGSR